MAILDLSYLNDACFLSLNVDDKKYTMCLEMAEDDLSDVLDVEFYNEIVSQYPSSFTVDNTALYDPYIKKFLAWRTYFHYLRFANVDNTPTGMRTFSEENSSIIDDIGMYKQEKNVLQEANRRKYKMVNFLNTAKENDSTKYPLYKACKKEMFSFGFSSISKDNQKIVSVNKAIISNE